MASRAELERDWSAADVVTYHALLDTMDAATARARREAERAARTRPR